MKLEKASVNAARIIAGALSTPHTIKFSDEFDRHAHGRGISFSGGKFSGKWIHLLHEFVTPVKSFQPAEHELLQLFGKTVILKVPQGSQSK